MDHWNNVEIEKDGETHAGKYRVEGGIITVTYDADGGGESRHRLKTPNLNGSPGSCYPNSSLNCEMRKADPSAPNTQTQRRQKRVLRWCCGLVMRRT